MDAFRRPDLRRRSRPAAQRVRDKSLRRLQAGFELLEDRRLLAVVPGSHLSTGTHLTTLTLALADGRRATVRRSEIDEFRNTGISLMPEGLQQELDPAMLRDLIEYLRSESFLQSSPGGKLKGSS